MIARPGCLLGLLLSLMTGCTTVDSMATAPMESGRAFQLHASCQLVAPLVIPTVVTLRMKVESKTELVPCGVQVIVSTRVSAFTSGELVRVRLIEAATGSTLYIYTRPVHRSITARDDWSMPIYQALVNDLEKKGQDDL